VSAFSVLLLARILELVYRFCRRRYASRDADPVIVAPRSVPAAAIAVDRQPESCSPLFVPSSAWSLRSRRRRPPVSTCRRRCRRPPAELTHRPTFRSAGVSSARASPSVGRAGPAVARRRLSPPPAPAAVTRAGCPAPSLHSPRTAQSGLTRPLRRSSRLRHFTSILQINFTAALDH